MSPLEIGSISVIAIVVLIYLGLYIPIALALVSFVGIWLIRDNVELAINLLKIAIGDSVTEYAFATVPLFTFMGLIVSKAGLGTDVYDVMNDVFRRVKGGIGMATVGANAVFAAVTGSSIASASVFTRVAVPEMLRYGYNPRFAVGVVAGSSVLGMIIPPSAMLIIYSFVAEQSIGQMFLAGIVPGLILAFAYIITIFLMGRFTPNFIGAEAPVEDHTPLSNSELFNKTIPIQILILVVLGGIYRGWLTPVEAGACGSAVALIIALVRKSLTLRGFWQALIETGHITASILFLITAASMYSRMLGFAGLPNELSAFLDQMNAGFVAIMIAYVLLMLVLGTLLDTHPDRRAAVPADHRADGAKPGLVRDRHRDRCRNRPPDAPARYFLFCHQGNPGRSTRSAEGRLSRRPSLCCRYAPRPDPDHPLPRPQHRNLVIV